MMSASFGTAIALMGVAVGKIIVGPQMECGQTDGRLFSFIYMTSKCTCPNVQARACFIYVLHTDALLLALQKV